MRNAPVVLISVLFGFILGYFPQRIIPSRQVETKTLDNRLNTVITLNTPDGILDIAVYPDEVYFQPFENVASPFKSFTILKTEYPKLFEQRVANLSFISAKDIVDEKTGKTLVIVSNNQPDHGAYSMVYQLVVDPTDGRVIEQ